MKKLYHILFIVLLSSLFQSAFSQNRAFLNGDFESPVMDTATESQYFISNNAPATYTDPRIKEWNTTASDFNVELRTYLPKTNKGETSAVGNQHAEINATKVSRLYQNVCLVNGETINYSFYHRGRKGYDDMEVNLYNAAGTAKITVLKNSGDDKVAWKQYSDLYFVNVPTGVYQFSFESVSQSGSASEGNLLDDIYIGMSPMVTFPKATYSAVESGIDPPEIKVNGTVPVGGMLVTMTVAVSSSAKEGADFTLTKTITIPSGEYNTTSAGFPVDLQILDDGIVEADETVSITIQSITNGGITGTGCGGFSNAVYTIVNDDVFDAGLDQIVCPGDSVVVSATGGLTPRWNLGVKQGVRFKAPLNAGVYTYTARDTSYTAGNLVLNGDFSNGNTGFTSDYLYDPRVDPTFTNFYLSEGRYNVTTNPRLANSSFYSFTDHTAGAIRQMLAVNGSIVANTAFWSQTIPVKPNTLYILSAWVSSSSNIDPASLQFSINGTSLGTPFQPASTAGWAQIQRSWNSGASTTAIIRGISTNTMPTGNDFAIDDIVFSPILPFSDSLKITVKPAPVPVTKDIDTCQKTGNHTLTAIGTNLVWYSDSLPASVGSSTAPIIDLNVPDTLTKWVSQVTNGCESARVKLKVSIRVTPKAPVVHPIDTCQRVGMHTLTAMGTNLKWYTVAAGGTGNNVAPIFDLNVPDTTTRWVSQSINGCEGPRSQLDITVRVTPVAPITKNIDTCQRVGTYTLPVAGTHLKWYTVATGGTASAITPSFNLNIPDTTSRWVSEISNGCEGPRSQVDIAIRVTPTAPITKNIDTCQRTGTHTLSVAGTNLKWYTVAAGGTANTTTPSFNLNIPDTTSRWVSETTNGCEGPRSQVDIAIKVTPEAPITKNIDTCQRAGTHTLWVAGTNLKWYTVATGGTANTVTPSINLNIPDTTSRWVSQTLNGCEGPRSQVDIAIRTTPLAPVTRNIDTCQRVGTHTLLAAGSNLKWYTVATGGTASTITPAFNLNIPDTTKRWVSQTLNGCEGPRSQVDIAIRTTPLAPVTKNIDTCQRAGTYTLLTTGTNLKWYTVATGGTASLVTPSFNLNIPDTTSRWVSQSLNGCEGPRSQVDIAIRTTPLAPVTKDLDTCQIIGTYTLVATGTNLKWYTTSIGGTASTVTPSFNLNIPDTANRWVSQTLNGCEGPRSQLDIAIKRTPTAPVIKNIDTCQRAGVYVLTAIGSNLKWYTTSTGGTASTTAPSFNLNVLDTTSRWVSQTLNGCEGPRSQINIAVRLTLPAPVTKNIDTCQKVATHTLTATGSNLKWYTIAIGGTSSTLAPSFDLNIPDTSSRWVSQSVNGCEGPRAQLNIAIRTTPLAPVTKNIDTCQRVGMHTFTATGTNLTWYTTAIGNLGSPTAPTSDLNVPTTTNRWVSQTLNGCEGPRSISTLNVKSLPSAPLVKDTSLCQKAGTLSFKATGSNLIWYPSGAITGSASTPSISTITVQTTTYSVSQTVNGCEGPKATESIEIRPTPLAPSPTNQELCQAAGTVSYSVAGSNLKWYTSATSTISSTITPTANRNVAGIYLAYASQTQNNCESPRQEVSITINATPAAPTVPNAHYCLKESAQPLTGLTDSLFWYTVATGGTRSSVIPVPNTQVTGVSNHWVSAVKKGCEGPRTAVTATVHALPIVAITGTLSGSYCAKSTLPLFGTGAIQYEWKLPSGGTSNQANATIASFVAANQGIYVLKGTDANQCSAKDSITLTLKNPPAVSARPVSVCEKAPILIQAQTTGTAYWKLPGNRIQNSSRLHIPVSTYADNGRYVVVSTQNGCTDSTELTITVTNCKPTARDDFYSIFTDEKLVLDASNHPIHNDSDPNDKLAFPDLTFLSTPLLGQLSSDANGFWTYKTNGDVEGKEVLEYQICDRGTPILCTTAKVEIEIKKRDAFFPDAFTPNGDGINDTYTIYHLSSHIKVDLSVFNRWGDLVYQNSDYQNTWKGTCEASACLGSELPVGTYFVVVQLSNGYKHTTYLTLSR